MTVSGSRAIDLIYIDEPWRKNSGQGGSIWKFIKATEKNALLLLFGPIFHWDTPAGRMGFFYQGGR